MVGWCLPSKLTFKDFAHNPASAHGHPAYGPSPAAFASAFFAAWNPYGCPLDCRAAQRSRGRFAPSGETGGQLNSEDIRTEAVRTEKLWTKYAHL